MCYKDIDFWGKEERFDVEKSDWLKETSPFEFYFEKLLNGERKCICTNQDLVDSNNFCEICNGIKY